LPHSQKSIIAAEHLPSGKVQLLLPLQCERDEAAESSD